MVEEKKNHSEKKGEIENVNINILCVSYSCVLLA